MEISKHGKNLNLPLPHIQFPASNREASELKTGEVKRTDDFPSQRLLPRLSGDADVRNRLLVEVQAKFLAGEYATRTAIEKAADQIFGL